MATVAGGDAQPFRQIGRARLAPIGDQRGDQLDIILLHLGPVRLADARETARLHPCFRQGHPDLPLSELNDFIGILGATVMPHNLYLHSSIVQTRAFERDDRGRREAIKYATLDSTIALMLALFINASILILAASTFFVAGRTDVAEIQDAYQLLSPMLGAGIASTLFAVALLASGQNSTITATLAGQIVMEGFLDIRLPAWQRRLITRLLAIIPAVTVAALYGESGTAKLLVLSQVVLSMQLPFAVIPLVTFTSDRAKMGGFANPVWLKVGA